MRRSMNRSHRRLAAAVLVLGVIAAACGDDGDAVSRLGEDQADLSVDDVQAEIDPGTGLDISYPTLDGGEANLTDFAGTPLVVNFFAAWCPSCVSEMPDFDSVFQSRDGEVAFVGISEDPRAEDSVELVAETGITYPTGWDPDGTIIASFNSFAMPTTVFVTADGQIAHMFSGALSAEGLDGLIDEHLL